MTNLEPMIKYWVETGHWHALHDALLDAGCPYTAQFVGSTEPRDKVWLKDAESRLRTTLGGFAGLKFGGLKPGYSIEQIERFYKGPWYSIAPITYGTWKDDVGGGIA